MVFSESGKTPDFITSAPLFTATFVAFRLALFPMMSLYRLPARVGVALCLSLLSFSLSAQWNLIREDRNQYILDAQLITAQTIVEAGPGHVAKSVDGGTTWTMSDQFTPPDLEGDPGDVLDHMWYSSATWTNVHFFDSQVGLASGWSLVNSAEIIIRTTNGGVTWSIVHAVQSQGAEAGVGITSMHFPTPAIGYASSFKGRVLKTTNGGQTWSVINTVIGGDVKAVHFVSATSGVAISGKKLYKTIDGGQNWAQVGPDFARDINTVYFINDNIGFVGAENVLYRTANGGTTWTAQPMSMYTLRLHFLDAQNGFAAGDNLYRTSDGGLTWTLQLQNPGWEFKAVHAYNASVAIAATLDGRLYKTTNGGMSAIPDISITSFTPTQALPGNAIKLIGQNLAYVHTVIVGDIPAAFSRSGDDLIVTVPTGIADNKPIVIKSTRQTVASTEVLALIKTPTLSSFTPGFGADGTTVTLSGYNLQTTSSVMFNNNVPASFTVVNTNTITATVPAGSSTGKIKVINPFGTATSYDTFTKYPTPTISSFTPTAYYRQGNISIYGTNFTTGDAVKLNGTRVTAWVKSPTEIVVWGLPAAATTGKFSVSNGAATAVSADDFTVWEGSSTPRITSFTPTVGRLGQLITVNGTNLYGVKTLTLNGQPLTFEVVSDNQIITEVSYPAQSGKIEGTNLSDQAIPTVSTRFSLQAGNAVPTIDAITPSSAGIQTQVVITGKNLYDIHTLFFNGENARASYVYDDRGITKLVTEVPATAQTGVITLGEGTTKTVTSYVFNVINNYCIPKPDTYVARSSRFAWLAAGSGYYKESSTADCPLLVDETAQVVEAKRGTQIPLASKPVKCTDNLILNWYTYLVYVDWNNDKDFYDVGELIFRSTNNYPNEVHYQMVDIPTTAPASGSYRARVFVTSYINEGPCECVNGGGGAVDFTLKIVDNYTTASPSFTALHPAAGTPGSTVSIEGQNLQTTQGVYIGGVKAPHVYNTQTGMVDVVVPDGTASGDIVVITQGGSMQVKGKLTLYPTISYVQFTPELDTIGAEVAITIPSASLPSVNGVSFNGTAASFRVSGITLYAKIPAGATTGKITLQSAFGQYPSTKDFTVVTAPSIASFFPATGHMGDYIVINGNNFRGITEVDFNGKPTRFTVVSPTQISAEVPRGASHGKISVVNKKATATSANAFTVLPDITTATFGEVPSFNYHSLNMNGETGVLDYDSDGLMDLVIGSVMNPDGIPYPSYDMITVYRNQGDGTFGPTDVRVKGRDFIFGDVDADGRQDMITNDNNRAMNIYYNDGKGFKSAPTAVVIPSTLIRADFASPIKTAMDFDHDGDLDIMLSGKNAGYFEQNNGTFTLKLLNTPATEQLDYPLIFEDIDKDGDTDILTRVKTLINNGGVFQVRDVLLTYDLRELASIDYNADGYPDLLGGTFTYYGKNQHLFSNQAGGSFQLTTFGDNYASPDPAGWGDFYNTGITGFLTHSWHPDQPNYNTAYFNFNYYDMPSSGQPALREAWKCYLVSEADQDHWWLPNKEFFDFENDGDIDFLFMQGGNRVWPRLIKNYTAERTGRINQPPAPPTLLTIERLSNTEVTLKWNVASDDRTPVASLSYNVRLRDETTGKLRMAPAALGTPYGNAGMMLSYKIKNLDPTHTYSFEVQAIDQGYRASAFSASKRFTLGTLTKPTGLVATPVDTRSIQLKWNDNTTLEQAYIVEYKTAASTLYTLLTTLPANTTTYKATGLACGTPYSFRVQATTDIIVSEFSDPAAATTLSIAAPTISGPGTACAGTTVNLVGSAGYNRYRWNDGTTAATINVSIAGTYQLTVADANGCESTATKTIAFTPLPVVTIHTEGLTLVAEGATTYEWYRDDEPIGVTTNTLEPKESGRYTVKGTTAGCWSFSNALSMIITGIEDMKGTTYVEPNPTTGLFTVHTAGTAGKLTITNTLGVEVFTASLPHADNAIEINLMGQTPGLYLITIQDAHGVDVQRLMIIR